MRFLLLVALLATATASAAQLDLYARVDAPMPDDFWLESTFSTEPMSSQSAGPERYLCSPNHDSCALSVPLKFQLPPLQLPAGAEVVSTSLFLSDLSTAPAIPVQWDIEVTPVLADCDGTLCPFTPAKWSPVKFFGSTDYDRPSLSLYTPVELKAGATISGYWSLMVSSGESNRWDNGFNAQTTYRWRPGLQTLSASALLQVEYEAAPTPEPGTVWLLSAGFAVIFGASRLRQRRH